MLSIIITFSFIICVMWVFILHYVKECIDLEEKLDIAYSKWFEVVKDKMQYKDLFYRAMRIKK